jgi:hypothetical protein
VLLAQGVRAVGTDARRVAPRRCSPRQVLLVVRDVIAGRIGVRARAAYGRRLAKALREQRRRRSAKVKRVWPSRTPHKPMKPPRFLTLSRALKALAHELLRAPT